MIQNCYNACLYDTLVRTNFSLDDLPHSNRLACTKCMYFLECVYKYIYVQKIKRGFFSTIFPNSMLLLFAFFFLGLAKNWICFNFSCKQLVCCILCIKKCRILPSALHSLFSEDLANKSLVCDTLFLLFIQLLWFDCRMEYDLLELKSISKTLLKNY